MEQLSAVQNSAYHARAWAPPSGCGALNSCLVLKAEPALHVVHIQ